jgi:hypothetical protein
LHREQGDARSGRSVATALGGSRHQGQAVLTVSLSTRYRARPSKNARQSGVGAFARAHPIETVGALFLYLPPYSPVSGLRICAYRARAKNLAQNLPSIASWPSGLADRRLSTPLGPEVGAEGQRLQRLSTGKIFQSFYVQSKRKTLYAPNMWSLTR